MKPLILVMFGGAIGSGLRYLAARLAWTLGATGLPWGTFAVNVIGGLAMGVLVGVLARFGEGIAQDLRLFIGVGLLGGFTTFSAFSLEAGAMIERGQPTIAFGYALFSVLASVAALFAGLAMTRGIA